MSVMPVRHSSSSEESGLVIDERKRKRMASNRDSARRSRLRKQQQFDVLINQAAHLQNENGQMEMQITFHLQHYLKLESENSILRTQITELTDRLQSINYVLQFMKEFSGIPVPLLNPWQVPCPAQQILANNFQF